MSSRWCQACILQERGVASFSNVPGAVARCRLGLESSSRPQCTRRATMASVGMVFVSSRLVARRRRPHQHSRKSIEQSVRDKQICYAKGGQEQSVSSEWHRYAVKEEWYAEYDSIEEFDHISGVVQGEVPAELRGGAFFRNGPANFERGDQRYNHVIDGDGLVVRIDFPTDGKAHFNACGRFIKTDIFLQESKQDRIISRSAFGTQRSGPWALQNILDTQLKNCANTHVVPWGGKLLALYETGLPYNLNPMTLETLGPETFDGRLREGTPASLGIPAVDEALGFGHAVTAHPFVDTDKGRLIIWSSQNLALQGSIDFKVTEWDEDWNERHQTCFEMEAGSTPHDFAVTKSFYIWVENRMALGPADLASYVFGAAGPAEGIEADPAAPVRVHLVARHDPHIIDAAASGARRATGSDASPEATHLIVETEPWFAIHHSHAEERIEADGATIITLYSAGWTGEGLGQNGGRFLAAWKGRAPDFDVIPPTHYWRTRIRVDSTSAQLLDHAIFPGMEAMCIDHPHVNPREMGSEAARYTYMTYCNSDGLSSPSIGWLRVNLLTGEQHVWSTPHRSGCFAQEPVVVPKEDGSGAWVLAMLNDHRSQTSTLCVLDGDDFARGPVCRLRLPLRLPHALHGSFMPAKVES